MPSRCSGAATFACLSGCHDDVPLRAGRRPERLSSRWPRHRSQPGHGRGSAGTRFTGRADGQLASRIKFTHRAVKSRTSSARFIGNYTSSLENSPLASAQWHGGSRGVRNRRTGKFKFKGLVLATFDDADRRPGVPSPGLQGKRRQNRRPDEAGPRRLHDAGRRGRRSDALRHGDRSVKLTQANKMRFRGRVTQRQGAERGFTPACTKLERKFGLTPLPD